ncbi:hypothetical protein EJ03DRAFT_378706 [Teratosphaeria nubilosa]|uniref:Uncharacterized protein n=1 Tax=Teratosphaeria nubilosa TaxID=161662 RepID=A0A6G1KW99_9PEZI|nr:hypothetical protein EJ03DRAFT_378706 [Teratosphaeria nubilosa]
MSLITRILTGNLPTLLAVGGSTYYIQTLLDRNLEESEARADEIEGTLRGHIGLIEDSLERLEGKKMDGKSARTEELYGARGKDEKKQK